MYKKLIYCMENQKTVHLFLKDGHVIPCIITKIDSRLLIGKNQQFDEIVVEIANIICIGC